MWALVRQRGFWIGILAGIVVGLFLGWFVWPVEYTDAYPSELRRQERLDYVRLAALDFARTGDIITLGQRLSTFDQKDLVPLFEEALQEYPSPEDQAALRQALAVIQSSPAGMPPSVAQPTQPAAAATPTPGARAASAGRSLVRGLSIFLIGLGVLLLAVVAVQMLRRGRERPPARQPSTPDWVAPPAPEREATATVLEEEREEEPAPATTVEMPQYLEREEEAAEGAPPARPQPQPAAAPSLRLVEMFSPVFILQATGEEGYDEGFTIYEGEENIGECGVGEAESLDDRGGKPIVMEIWLFDKHDTDTHQAYVLSPWAYRQPDIRQKYEDQGPVFEGQHGVTIRLNARTLYLEAEIKDVAYAQLGEGDEVFSKLALEMKVYRRIMPQA